MGRWCEIKCACPDRQPLITGDAKGMYNCGHKAGLWFEMWPGGLFAIGYALEYAFRARCSEFAIFTSVGDWQNYQDERFVLSIEEVVLWELEIKQLQKYLSGENYMGWYESNRWNEYFATVRRSPLIYGDADETLLDGLRLCQASQQAQQPIEFFW